MLLTADTGDVLSEADIEYTGGIPSEADIEADVSRIKNEAVGSLFRYEGNEWHCQACEHRCSVPYRMWEHILSKHFQGPLERCPYCKIYCKMEAALKNMSTVSTDSRKS